MFFGGGPDKTVLDAERYRKTNSACAQMNLSTLDVAATRAISRCFNSQGKIKEIDLLINGGGASKGLTDAQLKPIVELANQKIIQNQAILYKIEKTFQTLKSKLLKEPQPNGQPTLLSSAFTQAGKILENADAISSGIALLKDGMFDKSDSKLDKNILKALEIVASRMTDENILKTLEVGIRLSGGKAFQTLQDHFKKDLKNPRDLGTLVQGVFDYLREDHLYSCDERDKSIKASINRELIQSIRNGDLFATLDDLMGRDEATIKARIPSLVSVFNSTLIRSSTGDPLLFERLSAAFHDLNGPISCMKDAKSISNAAMHLISELNALPSASQAPQYILKESPLTLMALAPFCELPKSINTHYSALIEITEKGAMVPLAELTRTLSKPVRAWPGCSNSKDLRGTDPKPAFPGPTSYRPLATLLLNALADSGKDGTSGILKLIPTLSELTERDVWTDLLLVASSPNDGDRKAIEETLQFFVEPQSALDGKSIYDVFVQAISRHSYKHLFQFVVSLKKYMDLNPGFFKTALITFRESYYANSVHPYVELIREVMSEATQREAFFKTIFEVSDQPEFIGAIRLIAKMSQDNTMIELQENILSLFHKFAEGAAKTTVISDTELKPFSRTNLHDLGHDDLTSFKFVTIKVGKEFPWYTEDCRKLDLSFLLDQTSDPRFKEQFDAFFACQSQGTDTAFKTAAEFLLKSKTTDGKENFFELPIRLTKDLAATLSSWDVNYLIDGWLDSMKNQNFTKMLDAVPLWVGTESDSVLQPLLNVSGSIVQKAQGELDRLQDFGAHLLSQDQFPLLLSDLHEAFTADRDPPPLPDLPDSTFDHLEKMEKWLKKAAPGQTAFERIENWVEKKECYRFYGISDPAQKRTQIRNRVWDIINEPWETLNTWELVGNQPRKSFTLAELKNFLNPIFKELNSVTVPTAEHSTLQGTVNFLKWFTLGYSNENGGNSPHYAPDYLLKWLYERSTDYRLITYYYPKEQYARVRLVNSLDLLELVLESVNMMTPKVLPWVNSRNMAMDFLQEIGEAWSDLPRSKWPLAIQKKFPVGGPRPRTILEAVRDIVDRHDMPAGLNNLTKLTNVYVGVPHLPDCYQAVEGKSDLDGAAILAGVTDLILHGDQLSEFQSRIYNIHQVNSILEENAPGGQKGSFAAGLEVIRDLSFQLLYSSPEASRNPEDIEKNNLKVLVASTMLGNMHQLGRVLQDFPPGEDGLPADPVIKDLFRVVIRASTSPYLMGVLGQLFEVDRNQELIWNIISQVFDIFNRKSTLDRPRMNQFVTNLGAILNQLEEWVPGKNSPVLDQLLAGTEQILRRHQDFLAKPEVDLVSEFLPSKTLSSFTAAFYSNLKGNPERQKRTAALVYAFTSNPAHAPVSYPYLESTLKVLRAVYEEDDSRANWKKFLTQLDALVESPSYRSLNLKDAWKPLLLFLEEKASEDGTARSAEAVALARKLRTYGAKFLKAHTLDEFLILAKNNPKEFYQVLQTLRTSLNQGSDEGLRDFFKVVERSLSEPLH